MNDSPQAGAQPFLPFDGSHSSNGFASPTESPHDSMNGSYLRHETASVDSVQRLLPNSESIDGMYSNPDNPGFGPGLARANTVSRPQHVPKGAPARNRRSRGVLDRESKS